MAGMPVSIGENRPKSQKMADQQDDAVHKNPERHDTETLCHMNMG